MACSDGIVSFSYLEVVNCMACSDGIVMVLILRGGELYSIQWRDCYSFSYLEGVNCMACIQGIAMAFPPSRTKTTVVYNVEGFVTKNNILF